MSDEARVDKVVSFNYMGDFKWAKVLRGKLGPINGQNLKFHFPPF
jgi:hypothetical protein